jgi:hypothetical protein
MRPTTAASLLAAFLLTAAISRDLFAAPARPTIPAPREESRVWVVAGDWMPSEEEAVQDALKKAQATLTEYLRAQSPPMLWVPDPTYIRQRLWTNLNADESRFKMLNWKQAQQMVMGEGVWLGEKSWEEFRKAGMPEAIIKQLKSLDRRTFATREECRAALETVLDKQAMQHYQAMILNQAGGANAHIVQMEAQDLDPVVGTMFRSAVRIEVTAFARQDFENQQRVFEKSTRQHRAISRQKILAAVLGGFVALLMVVTLYLRMEDATKGYYTRLLRMAAVVGLALVGAVLWVMMRRM